MLSQKRARLARAIAVLGEKLAARGVPGAAEVVAQVEQFISVPDGVMIAFYPSKSLATRLAIPGGEPHDALHISLVLPGKLSSLTADLKRRLPNIVRGFALSSPQLKGRILGTTEFPPYKGQKPIVRLVDVPGLPEWRQRLVELIKLNGYKIAEDHGFIPHLTLKYADEDEQVEVDTEPIEIEFTRLTLMMGNERLDFPLGGKPADAYADLRGASRPGRKRREVEAVNAYQTALEAEYEEWADDAAEQLAAEDEDGREELLTALLLLLLERLRRLGQDRLPQAVTLAGPITAVTAGRLSASLASNDEFLTGSLIPAIQAKLTEAFATGGEFRLALEAGVGDAAKVMRGVLDTLESRVGSYANEFWALFNESVGLGMGDEPLTWHLDESVTNHCRDCLAYGNSSYANYEAMLSETGGLYPGNSSLADNGNCRCWLEAEHDVTLQDRPAL